MMYQNDDDPLHLLASFYLLSEKCHIYIDSYLKTKPDIKADLINGALASIIHVCS